MNGSNKPIELSGIPTTTVFAHFSLRYREALDRAGHGVCLKTTQAKQG